MSVISNQESALLLIAVQMMNVGEVIYKYFSIYALVIHNNKPQIFFLLNTNCLSTYFNLHLKLNYPVCPTFSEVEI
jgi:hypothetical protein